GLRSLFGVRTAEIMLARRFAMKRLHFCLLLFFLLIAGQVLMASATALPLAQVVQKGDRDMEAIEQFLKPANEPIRLRESKPVTVKDVQFVAVAQSDWTPAKPGNATAVVVPIDLQLRITNLSKGDILLPTFHTFG